MVVASAESNILTPRVFEMVHVFGCFGLRSLVQQALPSLRRLGGTEPYEPELLLGVVHFLPTAATAVLYE